MCATFSFFVIHRFRRRKPNINQKTRKYQSESEDLCGKLVEEHFKNFLPLQTFPGGTHFSQKSSEMSFPF